MCRRFAARVGFAERQRVVRERAVQPRQVDPAAAKAQMGTARVKLAVNQHGKITVHLYGEVMAKQALLSAVRAMPGAKPGAAGDWEVWPAQHDKLVQVLKGAGARNVVEVEKLPLRVLKGMGKGLQKAAAEMQEVSAEEAVVASHASPQMGILTMLSPPWPRRTSRRRAAAAGAAS